MANDYSSAWRQNHPGGGVGWSDTLDAGAYAGQLKASPGGSSADYLSRFEGLSKSDSDVDDAEGWKTVTNLENKDPANVESIKKQAEEWKAQGFDVRIQDLDNSQGAEWADLAVRKTAGTPKADAPVEPTIESKALSKAKAYAGAKDKADMEGRTTQMKHGVNPVTGAQGYDPQVGGKFLNDYINRFNEHQKPKPNTTAGVSETLANQAARANPGKFDEWSY